MEKEITGPEALADNDYQGAAVRLCKDGKYRWKYEMNMLTNPTIFLTVYKIFFFVVLGMFLVFGFFIYVIHGDWEGLLGMARTMLLVMAIFLGLTVLGVLGVALLLRGKYIVHFEMDERQVVHKTEPKQYKKAQKMGAVTAMAGMARASFSTAGAGMLSATKSESVSVFSHVRKVKPRRWLHVIKVNELLEKNQVYVQSEDFDFVYDFIISHCPNLK